MRWLLPLLFFGTAAGVAWYNGTHAASQIVFPLLDRLPGHELLHTQGATTWKLIVVIGIVTLLWAILDVVRARRDAQRGD